MSITQSRAALAGRAARQVQPILQTAAPVLLSASGNPLAATTAAVPAGVIGSSPGAVSPGIIGSSPVVNAALSPAKAAAVAGGQVTEAAIPSLGTEAVGASRVAAINGAQAIAPPVQAAARGASSVTGSALPKLGTEAVGARSTAARGAASVVEGVTGASGGAAPAGRFGVLARTPLSGASQFAQAGAWGGRLAPGTIGRAGLYGLGGQIAAGLFDSAVGERDGTWDDAASSALRWGGTGAGIGSMILPGWGTAIGGVGGALIGGAKGLLTGEDSMETQVRDYLYGSEKQAGKIGQVDQLLAEAGLSESTRTDLLTQVKAAAMTAKTPEEIDLVLQQVNTLLPSIMEQDKAQQEAEGQQAALEARMAAIQSYLQPIMQQQLAQYNTGLQASYDQMQAAGAKITDRKLAAAYQTHAANLMNSGRLQGLQYVGQMQNDLYSQYVNPQQTGAMTQAQYDDIYNQAYAKATAAADAKNGTGGYTSTGG